MNRLSRRLRICCLLPTAYCLLGCASLLQPAVLPASLDDVIPMAPRNGTPSEGKQAVGSHDGVTVKVEWLAVPDTVPASWNFFGQAATFVRPYTHHTTVLRVAVRNQSDKYLTLDPAYIELEVPRVPRPLRPLELGYFKKHWPIYAVKNDLQMRNQSVAIAHVVKTLFTARTLRPRDAYTGLVAFARVPVDTAEGHLVIKRLVLDRERFDFVFDFARPPGGGR